jgi:hypothetical protein
LTKAAVDNLTGNAAGMPSLIDRGIIPNGQEMVNAGRALAHNTGTGIANYLNRATQLKNYYKGGPEPTVPAPFSTVGPALFGDADQLPKPNIRHVPRLPKTPDAGPDALLAGFDSLPRHPGSSSEGANPSWLSRLTDFAQSPAGIATGIGLGGLGAGMYLGSRRRKDDDDDEKVASSCIVKALSTLLSLGMGAAGGAGATHYVHSKLNQDNLNQAKNKIETLNGLLENAYVTSEDRRKSYHDLLDEYNKARDFWKEDTQDIQLERLKAIKNELNNINGIYGDAQKVTDVSDNQFDIPKVTPNKTSGPNNLYSRFSSFIKTPTGMATGVGLGLGGLGLGMYMLNKQQKSKSNKNDNDVKLLAKKAANDTLDKVMQYGGIPLALTAGGAALGTGLGALHHPIAEAFSDDDDDPDARHQRLKDRLSSGAIGGSGVGMGIALSQLLRGAAKK